MTVNTNSGGRTEGRSLDLVETMERIRLTSSMSYSDWFELLHISWSDYRRFRTQGSQLPLTAFENVARYFSLDAESLLRGQLDFGEFRQRLSQGQARIPEIYDHAAFGRLRTSITSLEYLEKVYGWRLRMDTLRHFEIPESALTNVFRPISIRLITDICEYLHKRQFQYADFFAMGAYSYTGNRRSLIAEIVGAARSPAEAVELFFEECVPLFEHNCSYELKSVNEDRAIVDMKSIRSVADSLGVYQLGNPYTCALKAGIMSTITQYAGLSPARVQKQSCEHDGDESCRYSIDYTEANLEALRPPVLSC